MQQPLPKPNPRHSSLFGAMDPRSRPCRTRHTLLRWVKSTAENVKSPRNLRCRCLCGVRLKASCCVPGQQKKIFPMYSVKEVSLDPQRGDLLDAGVSPRPPTCLPWLVGSFHPPADPFSKASTNEEVGEVTSYSQLEYCRYPSCPASPQNLGLRKKSTRVASPAVAR